MKREKSGRITSKQNKNKHKNEKMSYSSKIMKWENGVLREKILIWEDLDYAIKQAEHSDHDAYEVRFYSNNNGQLVHVKPAKGNKDQESYA